MIYKRTQLLLLFSLILIPVLAQSEYQYKKSSRFAAKAYDITYKKPKGFIDLKLSQHWNPGGKSWGIGFFYDPIFQSKDGNCIVMYPATALLLPDLTPFSASRQAKGELAAALGIEDEKGIPQEDLLTDCDTYMKQWNEQKARKCFNADTVFVVELPLKKPYKEKYTYCTGIYISKKNRPTLFFKYFFTQEGKEREEEYIKLLYKRIWYRNENWIPDKEKIESLRYDIFFRGKYK